MAVAEPELSEAAPEEPIKVSAKGVDFFYGAFQALKSVSIDIPRNRITALIGPSGCGKTTFLRCINRMNDLIDGAFLKGALLIDGQNIYNKDVDVVHLRKRVGMVFQRPNPFPMSIFDNMAYGPRLHGIKKRADLEILIEKCLKRAFLWDEVKDKLNEPGTNLSGGQQQRLCIARVLTVEPEVILMDEPCSALDPVATSKIEDLMMELRNDYTVIIVTHNMQQAQRASDYTGFFLMGELVEFQDTSNLFVVPKKKETEDYISGRFG
ncbi:MAG: phosphate ABC transporter ATP-binding protein [Fimbriimonadales bacterium]|nr:phosphate ABC transporter ATP-binding protein [Fimbriimonadales bacterium]